jgi:hypothetical protein
MAMKSLHMNLITIKRKEKIWAQNTFRNDEKDLQLNVEDTISSWMEKLLESSLEQDYLDEMHVLEQEKG